MSGPAKCDDCKGKSRPVVGRFSYGDGSIVDLCKRHLKERVDYGDRLRVADAVDEVLPGATDDERRALAPLIHKRHRQGEAPGRRAQRTAATAALLGTARGQKKVTDGREGSNGGNGPAKANEALSTPVGDVGQLDLFPSVKK